MRTAERAAPMRARAARWIEGAHDELTAFFAELDGGGAFREDRWERPGGGGGVTRVMSEGATFEKLGVNRFLGGGPLTADAARQLGGRLEVQDGVHFFATGVSVVAHPRSPLVPTVHLNVRYFELAGDGGEVLDAWFGGGTDLTPTYPFPDDAAHFHRVLREVCAKHSPDFHPRFKAWCDRYFASPHRGGEPRGVGGIFFDHLRPEEEGTTAEA
ncbi:MAG TPA: coproporphyrinogen III oxidase, partial [Longimicrobiaceae bacterium]|nr:coproporphyrinogen III oxidase [Longimicrobiaceae bacterium]